MNNLFQKYSDRLYKYFLFFFKWKRWKIFFTENQSVKIITEIHFICQLVLVRLKRIIDESINFILHEVNEPLV